MNTIVIGAGPAGSACALWLHQLGCPVQLLEARAQAGGLQRFSPYENRWLPAVMGLPGQEVATHLQRQLIERGVDLQLHTAVEQVSCADSGFQLHLRDGRVLRAAQVVLATGARFRSGGFQDSATVAVGPGHPIEALDVAGKRVAVLGGGDNAFDQYGFLTARGARSVTVFARRVRAQRKLREQVPADDVVEGPFEADATAMRVNGQPFDVFSVQFGFEPVVPPGLESLQRSTQGFVQADHWGQTSLDGVYAAGEVAQTFHPSVVTSFAHGVQVAKHIQQRLGL